MMILNLIFHLLLHAHGQTAPVIHPPTAEETTVEDANSPVAIKPPPTVSVFDEEEGMIVKKLTSPFEYDRQTRRDPFRLPEISGIEIPLGAYFGPFLELQEIPLNDIKIKALILDPIRPKAIISYLNHENKTTNRKVFVGDYLGENYGLIQAIREGQIIIVQTFVEGDKKLTTTKTLNIRK